MMHIRRLQPEEELALHAVFYSAVHGLASKDYTQAQLEAWAPAHPDQQAWARRIQQLQPWVVEHNGTIAAYADLQADGYIDHFFVAAEHARCKVGTLLMQHLLAVAHAQSITVLSADVSRTAQPFFARFGFSIAEHRMPVVRGVAMANARMYHRLALESHFHADCRPCIPNPNNNPKNTHDNQLSQKPGSPQTEGEPD